MLEPIGSGGMSTVYAGEHTTLRRPVAIKVLHQQLVADSVMARRMIGEAFTIAGLHHPGIVGVLDVGVSEDGRAYVVMERLIGEPLSARVRRGRLPEAKVLVFARQIASALAATHAAGVIHRDLKPENLYVVPDPDVPGGERVKVLDFGIALRDHDGRERTLTGVVLGTPSYMAPEQLDGGGVMDPRVDVFALGVVMYQMVTGILPFSGADTEQLLVEQQFCAPTPAGSLAPVSKMLSAIIERCLAKRPADRYPTMADLAAELGRCGMPIPAASNAFDAEDTSPDVSRLRGERAEDEAGAAASVSTRDQTARHVARPPARTLHRWVGPVVIAAAAIVGIVAAMVPRGSGSATAEVETASAFAGMSASGEADERPSERRRPVAVRYPQSPERETPAADREPSAREAARSPGKPRPTSSVRARASRPAPPHTQATARPTTARRPAASAAAAPSPSPGASSPSPPPAGENRFAAVDPPTLY